MSVAESPGSCREGAGSSLAAYMAPPPKQRMRRCREGAAAAKRLTEQVAERTAAGGCGVVFLLGIGGGGLGAGQKTTRRTYHGRQCRWRSELL